LFVEQQKEGHQKALDALKSYAADGDQTSLKTFASKAAPVVQGHLDKLNAMKM
jgi:putative membrane protein